jgi:hypothetical protein
MSTGSYISVHWRGGGFCRADMQLGSGNKRDMENMCGETSSIQVASEIEKEV